MSAQNANASLAGEASQDHRSAQERVDSTTQGTAVKGLCVSIVESVDAGSKITPRPFTWPQIVERIRNVSEKPSKDSCKLLKLATFGDRRNAKGNLRHDDNVVEVFGIEGDYDHEKVTPTEAAARLAAAGVQALIYTSPSHKFEAPRFRVLAPLSQSCAPAERARFVDLLNGALGGILATESWTLSQVYYFGRVTGAPYEVHETEGACIDQLDLVLESIGRPTGEKSTAAPLPKPTREWSAEELATAVAEVRRLAAEAGDEKFGKLFDGDMSDYGDDHSRADQAITSRAAMYNADPAVIDAVLRASALMRAKWDRKDYRDRTLSRALTNTPATEAGTLDDLDVVPIAPAERPKLAFIGTRKGKHPATIANLATALREPRWTGFEVAFDTFRDEVMITPRETEEWRAVDDALMTETMEGFERLGFRPIPRETMRNTLLMVAKQRKFDSAILWLNGLTWDGTPRVERFLIDYCHAEDNDYSRSVAAYLWTALAGRVFEPGCKADSVPILVGAQGAKKTSMARELVIDSSHFTTIDLGERDENLLRRMRGKLVGEIGELRGFNARDVESIKTFISNPDDNWIPKYQEHGTTFKRRLVFIGTTNAQEFLSDETGNRRWLPVRVSDIDIEAIRRDRLQLWAEGAALWRASGISWQVVERLAPAEHGQYMVTDSWDVLLDRWLDQPADDLGAGKTWRYIPFTLEQVMREAIGLDTVQMTRGNEMRVNKMLRFAGFTKRSTTIKGKSVRVWVQE